MKVTRLLFVFAAVIIFFSACSLNGIAENTPPPIVVKGPTGIDCREMTNYFASLSKETNEEVLLSNTFSLNEMFLQISTVESYYDYLQSFDMKRVSEELYNLLPGALYRADMLDQGILSSIRCVSNSATLVFLSLGIHDQIIPSVSFATGTYPEIAINDNIQTMLKDVDWSRLPQKTICTIEKAMYFESSSSGNKSELALGIPGLVKVDSMNEFGNDVAQAKNLLILHIKRTYGELICFYENPLKIKPEEDVAYMPVTPNHSIIENSLDIYIESKEDYESTLAKLSSGLGLEIEGVSAGVSGGTELSESMSKATITVRLIQKGPALTSLELSDIISNFLSTHKPVLGSSTLYSPDNTVGWISYSGKTQIKKSGPVQCEVTYNNCHFSRPGGSPKEIVGDFVITIYTPTLKYPVADIISYITSYFGYYVWLGGGNGRETDGIVKINTNEIQVFPNKIVITANRAMGRWWNYSYGGSTGEKSKYYGDIYFDAVTMRLYIGGDQYYDPGYRWNNGTTY
ncbi:MAG: hypothetical protein HPY53_01525 [Brevinematales bacterium]|nr:hypothetical protein [Brevinematales bacterium]